MPFWPRFRNAWSEAISKKPLVRTRKTLTSVLFPQVRHPRFRAWCNLWPAVWSFPVKFGPRSCSVCSDEYVPTGGNQRKCEPCREDASPPRECADCPVVFTPTRHTSDRCEDCVTAAKPSSYQCPFVSCLEVYVPDNRNPHKCPSSSGVRADRLAAVDAEPDLVVVHGPPVPANAIGVRN